MWIDNRITIARNVTTNKGNKIALNNKHMLRHIWLPDLLIPHHKMSKVNHGPGFHDEVVTFIRKEGNIWVDHWKWLKLTTTCQMNFNWFPLDVQHCFFRIQVKNTSR